MTQSAAIPPSLFFTEGSRITHKSPGFLGDLLELTKSTEYNPQIINVIRTNHGDIYNAVQDRWLPLAVGYWLTIDPFLRWQLRLEAPVEISGPAADQ